MKKIWLIESLLVILIIIVAVGCVVNKTNNPNYTNHTSADANQKNTAYEPPASQLQSTSAEILGGQSSSKIVLNTAMMKSPGQVTLYKTQHPKITKADAIAFAKKFNVTNLTEAAEGISPGGNTGVSVASKDRRYYITLSSNGEQSFEDIKRPLEGIDILENLPSDQEAEKIATAFLKEKGLFPEGAVFSGSIHEKTIGWTQGNSNQETVVAEYIGLGYARELNGMKVEGTQYMVDIGAHGDIISLFVNWKNYEPVGEFPVRSQESAFEELKQKRATVLNAGPNKIDSISIDQSYLAYHTTAVAYREDYLEPVWVFKGSGMADGKPVGSVIEYIPALTDEAVKSLSS